MNRLYALAMIPLFGCQLFSPAAGEWELEVEDVEHCELTMMIEQSGEDLEGSADLDCVTAVYIDGEYYSYPVQEYGVAVEGEYDDGDVELRLEYYDELFEGTVEIEIEGELDEDEFEGELIVDGDYWGDVVGDVDR